MLLNSVLIGKYHYFDFFRKRMTVIVRCPDGKIKEMCKGADSIISARLKDNGNN